MSVTTTATPTTGTVTYTVSPSTTTTTTTPLLQVGQQHAVAPSLYQTIDKPQFHGGLLESPHSFLEELEAYFTQTSTPASRKLSALHGCLQGTAATWWSNYDGLLCEYQDFTTRFLRKYNGESVRYELEAALYDSLQKRTESCEGYLLQKMRLWQRLQQLHPIPEPEAVRASIYGASRTFQVRLQAQTIDSFTDAVNRALDLDEEFSTARPASTPSSVPAHAAAKPRVALPITQASAPSPPQCWYCPERHFHRNCPVLQKKRQTHPPPSGNEHQPKDSTLPQSQSRNPCVYLLETPDASPLPRIPICINNRLTYAILDSAASENFVHHDYVPSPVKRAKTQAQLASRGKTLTSTGRKLVNVFIQDTLHQVPMLISSELNVPAILGLPWLRQQRVSLDFHTREVHYGTSVRQSIHWEKPNACPTPRTRPSPPQRGTSPAIPPPPRQLPQLMSITFPRAFKDEIRSALPKPKRVKPNLPQTQVHPRTPTVTAATTPLLPAPHTQLARAATPRTQAHGRRSWKPPTLQSRSPPPTSHRRTHPDSFARLTGSTTLWKRCPPKRDDVDQLHHATLLQDRQESLTPGGMMHASNSFISKPLAISNTSSPPTHLLSTHALEPAI